jgi:DNA-binding LacI/PurR family transcriptional regulator
VPTSLQDIADRAGVHRSTVSLALRNDPRIAEATRQRINALVQEMGYRTNPLIAALMQSRRSGRQLKHVTLAFVTNYPERYAWRPTRHKRPDFFPGAEARAKELGFRLEHFWLAEPGMTPQRFCDILSNRGITGVIVARLPPGCHTIGLLWENFFSVAMGMTLLSPKLHRVTENHYNTVSQAMKQCVARGYARVGFVFADANDSPEVGDRWVGAYLRGQMSFRPEDRLPLCPGEPTTQSQFAAWTRQHKPDAIIALNAPRVQAWLEDMGKKVPRDVGLVELEQKPEDDIAGVHYEPEKIGALAVNMLIGLMHRNEKGIPENPHEVLLCGEWYEGHTLPPRT